MYTYIYIYTHTYIYTFNLIEDLWISQVVLPDVHAELDHPGALGGGLGDVRQRCARAACGKRDQQRDSR